MNFPHTSLTVQYFPQPVHILGQQTGDIVNNWTLGLWPDGGVGEDDLKARSLCFC